MSVCLLICSICVHFLQVYVFTFRSVLFCLSLCLCVCVSVYVCLGLCRFVQYVGLSVCFSSISLHLQKCACAAFACHCSDVCLCACVCNCLRIHSFDLKVLCFRYSTLVETLSRCNTGSEAERTTENFTIIFITNL